MSIAAAPIADDPQKIEMILGQLSSLPTLAPIAVRLLGLTGRANADAREVARLIESDAGLTAQVLSLTRRASRGVTRENLTIERAVVLLGFKTVRQVVLATKMIELFPATSPQSGPAAFDRAGFWTHCLAVGCAARRIAMRPRSPCDAEDAFLGGLLHDLGKIALATCIPKSYERALQDAERRRIDILAAERAALGTDHTVAGRRLAQRWRLPDELAECIWLHHLPPDALPEETRRAGLVPTVWLADVLVRRQRLGFSGNLTTDVPLAEASQRAGIELSVVEQALKALPEEIEERAAWVGLADLRSGPMYAEALAASTQELGGLHEEIREQSRKLHRRAAFLTGIAQFTQANGPGTTVGEACAAAAQTIAAALEIGGAVVYMRDESGALVTLARWGARKESWEVIAGRSMQLRDETRAAELTRSGTWIAPAPAGASDVIDASRVALGPGTIWLLPLICEHRFVAGALLAAQADQVEAWRGESVEIEALATTLGHALACAAAQARAAALGENLVWAQQRLAAAQTEIAAARSLRMTAEMAAGAAHELNTPLALISGRAQLLRGRAAGEDDRRTLSEIVESAHRASDIISDLMAFAEPAKARHERVQVGPLLRELVDDLGRREAGRRGLSVDVSDRLPAALCDASHLRSAAAEIIRNAIEATPETGGRVQVKARQDPADDFVVIAVIDNGGGMTPDVRERAFDPFFSARPAGRQRGMGLARALRWIQASGGAITLEGAPGGGTVASIRIPAAAGATS